jgi:peptidoglycan hydrolase-like protein with peptidoglycan-binding domain
MEIKKGDKGQGVVDIQRRLVYLGYSLGPTQVDGFFAERTEAAVCQFQKDRNLPVTGIVDEKTWRCLVESTYRLGDRALYLRSPFFRGDDVKQLQSWLNTLGFRTELIDGIFGPSTERAVREFQENIGLTCDGIVGPETVAALNNLRFILDKKRPVAFSAFNSSNSIVELLAARLVGIGCLTPHKKQWLAGEQNLELVCLDIAYRLSNLLETLGAQTVFFKLDEPLGEAELNLVFLPLKKQPNTVVMEALANQKSQALASMLEQKLKNLGGTRQLSVKQATLNELLPALDKKTSSLNSDELVFVTL